ncbi:MAG: DUF4870 domain-containing protein [Deltaproteobacteria bacterium]
MPEKLYNLEFSGKIIPGWGIDEVKANLTKVLKANEEKIYKLFSGERFYIKKNVDHQTVIKISNILKDAGADCIIRPVEDGSAKTPPPLPPKSEPGQTPREPAAAAKPALAPADIRPKRWLMVPGETDLQINKPGTYMVYYETRAFTGFNIANHQLGRNFGIAIMDLATGDEIELKPAKIPMTEEIGTTIRQAIAEVQFDSLGAYSATVAGEIPTGDGLLLRRFDLIEVGKRFAWVFVLFFLGIIAGPVAALVVFVKRQNYRRIHRDEPISEKEERQWAMFAHLGTFSSIFVPLGNLIAPIVIWQMKKHESEFVVDQAKESLNFQITLMIYSLISIPLCFIVIGIFPSGVAWNRSVTVSLSLSESLTDFVNEIPLAKYTLLSLFFGKTSYTDMEK